jgi:hypothetical protein
MQPGHVAIGSRRFLLVAGRLDPAFCASSMFPFASWQWIGYVSSLSVAAKTTPVRMVTLCPLSRSEEE